MNFNSGRLKQAESRFTDFFAIGIRLMEPKDVEKPCLGTFTFDATCPETHWDGQIFLHPSPYNRPTGEPVS